MIKIIFCNRKVTYCASRKKMRIPIPISINSSYLGNNQRITEKSNAFVKITCRIRQSDVYEILVYLM